MQLREEGCVNFGHFGIDYSESEIQSERERERESNKETKRQSEPKRNV